MKILAIETCFNKGSVCLYHNGEFYEKIDYTKNNHSNFLPESILAFFKDFSLSMKDIDAVIVNHGPGTFTGIRVGIAFAKGLVFPFNTPMYGVSTIECFMLEKSMNARSVAVKALKDSVYFQEFDMLGVKKSEIIHIPISEIPECENLTTVGINIDGEKLHFSETPNAINLIKRFLFIKPEIYNDEPLYVRPVNAVIPPNMKPIK